MTSLRFSDVPEVLEVQEIPSDEVRIVPDAPTAARILFPDVTPFNVFDVPEVMEVQEDPSDEVRIVPEAPTETYDLVVVEVEEVEPEPELPVESSLPAQEMMAKPKPAANKVYKKNFINFLKKNNK